MQIREHQISKLAKISNQSMCVIDLLVNSKLMKHLSCLYIIVIYSSCHMLSKESKEDLGLRKSPLKNLTSEADLICI